jgi:hypothetical protein
MGPTTFRKGAELLRDAGSQEEYLALLQISNMQPFGKIYVTNGPLQEYAKTFFNLISSNKTETWIRQTIDQRDNTVTTFTCDRPPKVDIPRVRISPALAEVPISLERNGKEMDSVAEPVYVIVVQGQSGMESSKIVWRHNRTEIARAMFGEVINGYNVVFSAAMLMEDYQRLRQRARGQKVFFSTFDSLPALFEFAETVKKDNGEADRYARIRDVSSKWEYGMYENFQLGMLC